MYIKHIEIKNFRSIKHAKFECKKFNVFIGKNNHGKSNIFEALNYFFQGGSFEQVKTKGSEKGENPEITVCFGNAKEGLKTIQDGNKHKKDIEDSINTEDEITVARKVSNDKGKQEVKLVIYKNGEENKTTGIDGPLKDYLPRFRYINAREHIDKHDGYKKTNIIGELLSDIVEKVAKHEKFNNFKKSFTSFITDTFKTEVQTSIQDGIKKYLNEQFDDTIKSFTLDLEPPKFEDLMKNFKMTLNDGVETKVDEKGDGLQRALIIAMLRFLSEQKENGEGKKTIFCIDEAELHLHFETQRLMEESLEKIPEKGGQVFINTHSPVFMTKKEKKEKEKKEEKKAIFKVEKEGNETKIEKSEDFEQILYNILGGMPSDYLFPNNFLIVEGCSEKIFLEIIIKRFYEQEPKIQIINAKSNTAIRAEQNSVETIASTLHDNGNSIYANRLVILMDKPSKPLKGNSKLPDIGERIQTLKKECLEACYPENLLKDFMKKGGEEMTTKLAEKNNLKEDAKLNYAKKNKTSIAKFIGEQISKKEFEEGEDMSIMFKALKLCWGGASENRRRNKEGEGTKEDESGGA